MLEQRSGLAPLTPQRQVRIALEEMVDRMAAVKRFTSIPLLVILAFSVVVRARGPAKPPESFDVHQIDSYLASEIGRKGQVGLSVAIVKDGKVVLAKGYGRASLESNVPVESGTVFAIGSITKQFTCACVLLLAQDGKLSIHDKVAKYFPKLMRADTITVLDLMNHTSGYSDYYPLDFVDRRMQKPISPDDLIREYAGGQLDFDPGTTWSYSNTGYIILGRIVEMVSGQSFGDVLTDRLFKPIGMTNTLYEPDANDRRLAAGYASFALSQPERVRPEGKGWIGAAGGVYSTPSDLAKWDLALMDGKVLKPEFYRVMTTPRELSSGKSAGYGCGLQIGIQEGRTVLRHGGAVSGFHASNALIPSTRSAVVVFCNKEGGLGSLPDTLLRLLLHEEANVPRIAAQPAADVVKSVFVQFQSGNVDRAQFGEEFNIFLTDSKIAGASDRLKSLGAPRSVNVLQSRERGGMEVTTTRLTFPERTLQVLMYRKPDGKIEQYFIDEPDEP
jgi:CubicO group peptidase (beta-lactamase class C family)